MMRLRHALGLLNSVDLRVDIIVLGVAPLTKAITHSTSTKPKVTKQQLIQKCVDYNPIKSRYIWTWRHLELFCLLKTVLFILQTFENSRDVTLVLNLERRCISKRMHFFFQGQMMR